MKNLEKFFTLDQGNISNISDEKLAVYKEQNPGMNIDPARIKVFRASTEAVDRAGDVILQDGWDLKNYAMNPVFLAHHNSRSFPIGKTLEASVTTYKGVKGLYLTVYFPTKDISEDADMAFKAVESGLMTAVSVGFQPLEYEWIDSPTKAAQYNMPIGGILLKKCELTECSLVSVPCNQEAVLVKEVSERITKAFGADTFVKIDQAKELPANPEVTPEVVPEVVTEVVPEVVPTVEEAKSFYALLVEDVGSKVKEKSFFELLIK